ncbi:MAG: hypothetical protein V1867_04895 [Candidatus Falkowbacteria bacterium]
MKKVFFLILGLSLLFAVLVMSMILFAGYYYKNSGVRSAPPAPGVPAEQPAEEFIPPPADQAEEKAPKNILYLKKPGSGEIDEKDLERFPEIYVVYDFEDLKKYAPEAEAIWVDRNAADLIEAGWFDNSLKPVALLGYNNALYSFREVLPIAKTGESEIDWSLERLEPGFSVRMPRDGAGDSEAGALTRGYDRELNAEAVLIATNDLLGKENYAVAELRDETCSGHQDCETPFEYLIRSSCPYDSRCLEGRCAVVCPYILDPEWVRVTRAILDCEAAEASQNHDLAVAVGLKNGGRIGAFEPEIDEIIRIADEAAGKCGEIRIATE